MTQKKKVQISNYTILSISIGLVYLWFGALKFFPDASPAEKMATGVIDWLTFGLIPENISILLLAFWETIIGLLLILNVYKKIVIPLALVHISCTFLPLFVFPEQSFTALPFGFTLAGQYIFKNIIIVSSLVILLKQSKTQII
tara:strand:+ start:22556 stop:22984 length:429 start_codon:yes stop_codon:yes gene_type:complete